MPESNLKIYLDAIRRIVQTLNTSAREVEKTLGVSMAQLFVLQKLMESGTLSVNELALATYTHQSSVSVVVQKLKDRKLVSSKPSQADGRRMEIMLTSEGKKLMRDAPDAAQYLLIAAFKEMPKVKQTQLATLLHEYTNSALFDKTTPPKMLEKSH